MMPIIKRLQKLEQLLPPPEPAPSGPSFRELIEDEFARSGFVRGEKESLAETFARFLGISLRELRTQLERQAPCKLAELATDIRS